MSSAPRGSRTALQRRRRNRRRTRAGLATLGLVVLIGAGAWLATGGGDTSNASPHLERTRTTVGTPATQPSTVATTKVAQLKVFTQPDTASPLVTTLTDTTEYGLRRTLLVDQQQGAWLHTLLPIRPNGSNGWVQAGDVTLSQITTAITVSISKHELTLLDNGKPVLTAEVAVGTDQTPTPPGHFYITDPIDLTSSPNGTYGAYALGLSGYSEVLMSFNGGPGQLAVHGTPDASQAGKNISNGCVRVPNDKVVALAKRVGLGTPVTITA